MTCRRRRRRLDGSRLLRRIRQQPPQLIQLPLLALALLLLLVFIFLFVCLCLSHAAVRRKRPRAAGTCSLRVPEPVRLCCRRRESHFWIRRSELSDAMKTRLTDRATDRQSFVNTTLQWRSAEGRAGVCNDDGF